jgi:hypothetical protein
MGGRRCDDGEGEHDGGLDVFPLKAKADVLAPRALGLKREIERKAELVTKAN